LWQRIKISVNPRKSVVKNKILRRQKMKIQTVILATIAILCMNTAVQAKYSGGTGEPNDPYLISTAEDMNAIGTNHDDWNAYFLLVADINLADYTGTQFNIIGTGYDHSFTGVFDGNGHKIWNFTWTSTDRSYIGLFRYVGTGGKIKNLGMENVDVNAVNGYGFVVGGMVGRNWGGTISNCYANGIVAGDDPVGGLVGENHGTISNCYANSNVTGGVCVGGLVGNNWNSTITNCHATGSVLGASGTGGLVGHNSGTISDCYAIGEVSGYDATGGLVGFNIGVISDCYATGVVLGYNREIGGLVGENDYNGIITNCYSTGSVSGERDVGGLVGFNNFGEILNCYATGRITGNNYVGGLVGYNKYGTITNCYSTGIVDGNNYVGGLAGGNGYNGIIINCYSTGSVDGNDIVGGLVGMNGYYTSYPGYIYNCYSVGSVVGDSNVGGLVGKNIAGETFDSFWDVNTSGQSSSAGGTPKTTAEMQAESTFTDAGWDFIEIWDIGENQTYPFLRIYPAGDLNHDDIVNFYDFAIFADHWLE
jgi:hypothetical protein